MANENLGNAALVTSILQKNGILVEVDGSIRRITFDNFMNSLNSDDEQLLRQVAWGIPLKENQSSPEWGVVGNTGMWSEFKNSIGRYLMTNEGKAAKLSSSNSNVFADGTTLDETKGHVVVIAPNPYYRIVRDAATQVDTLWISMLPIGGHRIGGDTNDYIVLGAYKGSMNGTALVSRSGVAPAGSRTITAFWTAAQVNGKNWGLTSWDHVRFMAMLGLSEYGNPNIQDKLGYGIGGSSNLDLWAAAQKLLTGATASLGDHNGKIPINVVNGDITGVNCSRVNLFGIEDPYNWQWEMIQGIYFGNSENSAQDGSEVYIYEGNRMPIDAELASHPNGNYRQITRRTAGNGYVKNMFLGEYFDLICKEVGGGTNSYWCDYFYTNTTGQLCLWGGLAVLGSYSGLGCVSSYNAFSYSLSNSGARLAYYGPVTFITGKEMMAA